MIQVKSIYEKPSDSDGFRVFIERELPHSLSVDDVEFDWWPKDIALGADLLDAFERKEITWMQLEKAYFNELKGYRDIVDELRDMVRVHGLVTLLHASNDVMHNSATALFYYLTHTKGDDDESHMERKPLVWSC